MTRQRLTTLALAAGATALWSAGCEDGPPPGQYHETLCNVPFINEDFLAGDLDVEWEDRVAGGGTYVVSTEGSGADRRGWLTIDSQGGDMSATDRSAYGIVHVGPSDHFHLRAELTSPPSGQGQVAGLFAEENGTDSVVAVGLRGQGGGYAAEMLGVAEGAVAIEGTAPDVGGSTVLVELIRYMDEWIGRVDGEEVGTGELPIDQYGFKVGLYLGSSDGSTPSLRVEWIDACRYYPGRDQ